MTLHILMIEPYYGGSHQAWIDGYGTHSQHDIQLLSMPAEFWKWRMQGGAVTMSRKFQGLSPKPDLIISSDMMDVSLFRAITRTNIPIALYFHENQLTYPQNRRQHHGWQYGFINYASALAADAVLFNSQFHFDNFFEELPRLLKHFADFNELQTIDQIRAKSNVLPLGLDLQRFDNHRIDKNNDTPVILWNHRWEADKNPQTFFEALTTLDQEGFEFEIVLLGENFRQNPTEFVRARDYFGDRIRHYGYAESFADYAELLWQADYVISPAYQDFFGISVAEAIYCECIPLLANRLNYPFLLPEAYHAKCLFRDNALTGLLRAHLQGKIEVDTSPLRHNIAQYDWEFMAPIYDSTLQQLVNRR